jgi:N,N'-diacetyllegionaminate synthase
MTQVISELCQNHNGDMKLLKDMVQASAEAGAAFAKIQSFFADDLSPDWRHDYDRLKKLELNWDQHAKFVEWCKEAKILPMTSAYTYQYAPKLWECGFRHIKIGSAQAWDADLIQTYVEMGFQVLISTGGRSLASIPKIWPVMGWLHCVSAYPADPWKANLIRMLDIRKVFPSCAYGLSDHTDPTHIHAELPAIYAMLMGAKYLEKHFTMLPREATKDGSVSITSDQLRTLCSFGKLSLDEKLERSPNLGLFVYPQLDDEIVRIAKYEGRWKRQAA